MNTKWNNAKKLSTVIGTFLVIGLLWQIVYMNEIVPRFMLPSPLQVINALYNERNLIFYHMVITLYEAFVGLSIGIILGFVFAVAMDRWTLVYRILHPLIVFTQTIPTVAIAPLLVLWLGYGMTPKIVLIVLTTFFPITIGIHTGFQSVDPDSLQLMNVMGASTWDTYKHLKIPATLNSFYSGLKISASYALIGAVIAEWLGGFRGLGVYMTRVRKSLSYDKMLAVIFLISLLSLVLMAFVAFLQKKTQPWNNTEEIE